MVKYIFWNMSNPSYQFRFYFLKIEIAYFNVGLGFWKNYKWQTVEKSTFFAINNMTCFGKFHRNKLLQFSFIMVKFDTILILVSCLKYDILIRNIICWNSKQGDVNIVLKHVKRTYFSFHFHHSFRFWKLMILFYFCLQGHSIKVHIYLNRN